MIGDPQIGHSPIASGLRHLGQGVRSVAPIGVAVKRTRQIAGFDQLRQLPRLGCLDLAAILSQLGRDLDEAECLEQVRLGLASNRPRFTGECILVQR